MSRPVDWLAVAIAAAVLSAILPAYAGVPTEANRYRSYLTRQARVVWGINAPIADFAAQIHQESGWKWDARSQAGAKGLAQFMPATAVWLDGLYEMGGPKVYNPVWSIRAMVTYDRHLWDRLPQDAGNCHRMGWSLRAYNGGAGYLNREARTAGGWDYAGMEKACTAHRAGWACRENIEYPRRILTRIAPLYQTWGARSC